jgi:hypothetical protein
MKTAMFAISSSVISRRVWVLLARNSWNCSQVVPDTATLREYERRRVKRANAVVRASRRTGRAAEVVMKALPDRLTVAQLRSSGRNSKPCPTAQGRRGPQPLKAPVDGAPQALAVRPARVRVVEI